MTNTDEGLWLLSVFMLEDFIEVDMEDATKEDILAYIHLLLMAERDGMLRSEITGVTFNAVGEPAQRNLLLEQPL